MPVGSQCRLDETYIKVNGKWCYLYRTADKEAKTIIQRWKKKKRSKDDYVFPFIAKSMTEEEKMNSKSQFIKTVNKYMKRIGKEICYDKPLIHIIHLTDFESLILDCGWSRTS